MAAAAEGITAEEIGLAAEVASRFAICIFVAVGEHTDSMYEAQGMLAVAVNFHIFILLSTLGSFLPRQLGGETNSSEVDQTETPTHRQDSKLHCQKA